jgi:hypothetical protein
VTWKWGLTESVVIPKFRFGDCESFEAVEERECGFVDAE